MVEVLSVSNMNGHIQNQLTKSLERILEEAHLSGELKLSGRKLKDFPKTGGKYDLRDTVVADLSKNKFWELPPEILEFLFIEKLHLYHNALRSLPDGLGNLQYLKFLDLSRNQLCVLPAGLCQLEYLEVLLIANNKLSALPNDIGSLKNLMELNASCNEISHLPKSMSQLKYLRALDLRKNLLEELPIELTYLKLTLLDLSENRISSLPVELRLMSHLERLILTGNPLLSPPATVCIRGRVHIFKFLETQVHKTDKKRGGAALEDVRRTQRQSDLRYSNGVGADFRAKRHTVDSGYSTSDGMDPKWTQEYKHGENVNKSKVRGEIIPVSNGDHQDGLNGNISGCSTPSTISPGDSFNNDDETNSRQVLLQDQLEAKRLIRLQTNERGHCPNKISEKSSKMIANGESGCSVSEVLPVLMNNNSGSEEKKKFEHVQTYREYKEARRLQRAQDVYRLKQSCSDSQSPMTENSKIEDDVSIIVSHTNEKSPGSGTIENGRSAKKPIQKVTPSRNSEPLNSMANGDSAYLPSYVKPSSPVKGSTTLLGETVTKPSGSPFIGRLSESGTSNVSRYRLGINSLRPMKWNADVPADKLSFTMRREFERAKEEAELIEQLRQHIEGRLKMSLPEEMGPALMDGVVLCHLANYVRPRSVASIHVPSPAVPKLTMARCRRNVDNFLDACRKIGVEENMICFASDVLEGRGLVRVSITVAELLKFHTPKSPAHVSLP